MEGGSISNLLILSAIQLILRNTWSHPRRQVSSLARWIPACAARSVTDSAGLS